MIQQSFFWLCTQRRWNQCLIKVSAPLFTATLLTVAKWGIRLNCLLMDHLKQKCNFYMFVHYSAFRIREGLGEPHAKWNKSDKKENTAQFHSHSESKNQPGNQLTKSRRLRVKLVIMSREDRKETGKWRSKDTTEQVHKMNNRGELMHKNKIVNTLYSL